MSNLTQKIMRRVYVVWLLRQLLRRTALRVIALGGIFWSLQFYISFRSVIANANLASTENLLGSYGFWRSAFAHTEASVQVLMVLATAITLWFGWDIFHSWLTKTKTPRFLGTGRSI